MNAASETIGLPELQRDHVSRSAGNAWSRVMTGIAYRLVKLWISIIRQAHAPFVELPVLIEVSAADVAAAYGLDSKRRSRARVRLELDPRVRGDSFLNVESPPGSGDGWLAIVCMNLVGLMPPLPPDAVCPECEREGWIGGRHRRPRGRR